MPTCDQCKNDYDRAFTVTLHDGTGGTFDSFNCAITKLAPTCKQCGCRIIGHGRETSGDDTYCCASCAKMASVTLED